MIRSKLWLPRVWRRQGDFQPSCPICWELCWRVVTGKCFPDSAVTLTVDGFLMIFHFFNVLNHKLWLFCWSIAGLSVMLSNCLANRKDCLLYLNVFINHAFQTPSAQEGPQQVEVQRKMTLGGSLSQEHRAEPSGCNEGSRWMRRGEGGCMLTWKPYLLINGTKQVPGCFEFCWQAVKCAISPAKTFNTGDISSNLYSKH